MDIPPLPEPLIRLAKRPDEIFICAEMMAASEPWITLRRDYEVGLKWLQDATREIHVALIEDEVAGFLILNLRGPFSGYIQTICVSPRWRDLGLGRKLIEFAEARIFRESPNVFLCVSSFNTAAQRLYHRLGYTRVGELQDYVVAGHSEILMRKTLGPIADFQPRIT
jgi:ribosomal protein S18 acetylase RimI-like enzyme